jgi:hypothetical protein
MGLHSDSDRHISPPIPRRPEVSSVFDTELSLPLRPDTNQAMLRSILCVGHGDHRDTHHTAHRKSFSVL